MIGRSGAGVEAHCCLPQLPVPLPTKLLCVLCNVNLLFVLAFVIVCMREHLCPSGRIPFMTSQCDVYTAGDLVRHLEFVGGCLGSFFFVLGGRPLK